MLMTSESAAVLYKCTGCLACHEACRHKINVEDALIQGRKMAVSLGAAPYPAENFLVGKRELLAPLKKIVPKKFFTEGFQVIYFPGCSAVNGLKESVKAVFNVIEKLGIEYIGVSEASASCCGYPLYAAGFHKEFAEVVRERGKAFAKYRSVVIHSACCAHTMRNIYPLFGFEWKGKIDMLHEVVAPILFKTGMKKHGGKKTGPDAGREVNGGVAYHDSCFLGRHLNDYDLPRKMLEYATGKRPLELRKNRENSLCCGAGGGYSHSNPEGSAGCVNNLMEMARDTGAAVLVNACTSCLSHMKTNSNGDIKALDLMEIIAGAL
ncbi:MAG: (Fe-S)-binding protein [Deltaproteobacteria bacterium]|nr:(Fe-S)-binding protein [Deltaproteobacteria bacterium]